MNDAYSAWEAERQRAAEEGPRADQACDCRWRRQCTCETQEGDQ